MQIVEQKEDIDKALPPQKDFSSKEIRRHIIDLSWPCAIELMLASLISVITMMLVSSLGKEAVSAVGIVTQPIMIPNIILQAFSVGGMALIARALGMEDKAQARLACEQSMFLAIVFSIALGAVMYIFGGTFILWMGATPDYFPQAEMYMRWCSAGVIFQSISTMVASVLRAAGRTKLSMQFNVISNITNVVVGFVLINGFGPIPPMGIKGAAIAQLVAKVVGCVISLFVLFRARNLPIRPGVAAMFKPHWQTIKRICRVGNSSALEQLALRIGLIMFTVFVIKLGTAEYAAHNIAATIHSYVVNFGAAVSAALVSLVGKSLGADKPELANRYFVESIKICGVLTVLLAIPLLIIPQYMALMFTKEPDVIENIVTALRILAFFTGQQIFQIAICGGLRGGGDTTWPLISTMIGVLGMRMVLGYLFIIVFNWGLAGAWWCWLLDQSLRAVIIYFRFKGGKWKLVKV